MSITPVPDKTVTNGDELLDFGGARYIGNFHKTLPRLSNGSAAANASGEVDPKSYVAFARICDEDLDCEYIPAGVSGTTTATELVNPQAGRASELLGPSPQAIHMMPAPSVLSDSTAAEMVELYWMAKLRDTALDGFETDANVSNAISDIAAAYQYALSSVTRTTGDLRLGLDLPQTAGGALDIRPETLFRCGLRDEDKGPLISQFLLHDINYGVQLIQQTQVPYADTKDYLKQFPEWLAAQTTGKDSDGNGYAKCNNYAALNGPSYYGATRRRIATMRDMARFVNRDALHQAYFNAALLLDGWGARLDVGNPYPPGGAFRRQIGFGTLGAPNLLALVSEVASRALKVVWRQKWLHRRLRPEAYGGLLHVQQVGSGGANSKRAYGLPTWPFAAPMHVGAVATATGYLLPMAFTAGSPAHPAYGAGHATVAGACVTILKAWFDEDQHIQPLLAAVKGKDPAPDFPANPPAALQIWEPGTKTAGPLPVYTGADDVEMTVGGELNKLASNVALGRSMGGVHWRSDNTRSLRLGEQVATIMLKRILPTYAERPLSLTYRNFDQNIVTIAGDGHVSVAGDPGLEAFYNTRSF